jgi:pullulanase
MAGSTTSATMMTQANAGMVTATEGAAGAVAVFNDYTRDGLKGSVWDQIPHGYINGNYAPNTTAVKFGISGAEIPGTSWKVTGGNVINYMSCHDNMTLWDILLVSSPDDTEEDLMARNRLGIAVLMVSKGVPFWQAGEEMLRTKDGNHNSYNASDEINNIKWDDLAEGSNAYEMMRYYQGLIAMRKAYDIFRANSTDVTETFDTLSGGGIVAKYVNNTIGEQAIVLINPAASAATYTLSGQWSLVANGTQAGAEAISTATGEVTVDAYIVLVFVQ